MTWVFFFNDYDLIWFNMQYTIVKHINAIFLEINDNIDKSNKEKEAAICMYLENYTNNRWPGKKKEKELVGRCVKISIPKIYRCSTDRFFLFCKIINIMGNDMFYKINLFFFFNTY